jgi:hypothetical protein
MHIIDGVDLCSSFLGSKYFAKQIAQELCVNLLFFLGCYYWDYYYYCRYCAGKCSAWDIGLDRVSGAQGPFLTVQLFGAWSPQVQWCAASLLQPVSCEAVLWQSPPGSRHNKAAGSRPSSLRGDVIFSLSVCTGFAPFLSHITNRHRVQNVWLCTHVNTGNIVI